MAATNVFTRIARLPVADDLTREVHEVTNAQQTPPDFSLFGGTYAVDGIGATFGTVTLNKRGADDATFGSVGSSTAFAANGFNVIVQLGPGVYRWVIA